MAAPVTVFIGRPGSGKGTQAKALSEKLGHSYFSTGDRFRELAKEQSALGDLVRDTIDKGVLMPHWFASYIVQDHILRTPEDRAVILDGSNRTLPEAQLFDEYVGWLGRTYRVLYLDVPEDVITARIVERARQGSGRADDTEETVRKRIQEYDAHTAQALAFFEEKNVVTRIDGNRPIEDIGRDILHMFS